MKAIISTENQLLLEKLSNGMRMTKDDLKALSHELRPLLPKDWRMKFKEWSAYYGEYAGYKRLDRISNYKTPMSEQEITFALTIIE
jgi:hypothetical protein